MNPDELTLARWMDDELQGQELADMDAWALQNPQHLKAREEVRGLRGLLQQHVAADEEVPYPDFFMTRLHQGIRDLESERVVETKGSTSERRTFSWTRWFMPLAACTCVALAFYAGRQTGGTGVVKNEGGNVPVLYTPEEGVDARWVAGENADAGVIILNGVSAIPDSTDFSATVYVPKAREFDRTATRESDSSNTQKQ